MYSKKETLDFLAYLKNALSENSLATTEAEMYNYQRSELQIIKESDSSKTAYELLGQGHCTSISPDYETVDYVPFADIYYREDCYDYLISEGISVEDACRLATIIRMGTYKRKGEQHFRDKLPEEFNYWARTITYLGSRSSIFENFYREYEEFKFKNKCNIPEIKINKNDVDSTLRKILSGSPEALYNHDIIKINNSTNDEKDNVIVVTDYIARKLLKDNILYDINFANTTDKTTYLSETLYSKPITNNSSYNYHNKKISIDLYNCHQYNECYTHITAHIGDINITVDFILNTKTKPAHYVPVMSFRFNCESLYESEFLQHYPTPDLLYTTADKLRWYRLKNRYLQSEIADMIGISRSTYIHYESSSHKLYELDKLQLLADLYQVDIKCLLDDYMLFLYRGQGKQLKALRKELGLTQKQFADMIGVRYVSLKQWERERCVMLYENYLLIKVYIAIDKTRTS